MYGCSNWVRKMGDHVCVCVCVHAQMCVCTSIAARRSSWILRWRLQEGGSTWHQHTLSPQSPARTSAPTLQTNKCTLSGYKLHSLPLLLLSSFFPLPFFTACSFSTSCLFASLSLALFLSASAVVPFPPSPPLHSLSGRAAEQWRPRWLA